MAPPAVQQLVPARAVDLAATRYQFTTIAAPATSGLTLSLAAAAVASPLGPAIYNSIGADFL